MGSRTLRTSATHEFIGILFDCDGTIIDSTNAIVKHWHQLGAEIGVDPVVILQTSHGRRSIDVLKIIAPEKANMEYVREIEGQIPKKYGDSAIEIPGARSLIDSLNEVKTPWAIVTSGTRPLVTAWLDVMKLPVPENLVTAEDVPNGKPDPTCYLMGKKLLGLSEIEGEILVVEDAPAGIQAGKAAGCKVLGLVTTHTLEQVIEAGADWIVKDLSSVKITENGDAKVKLEFLDLLGV